MHLMKMPEGYGGHGGEKKLLVGSHRAPPKQAPRVPESTLSKIMDGVRSRVPGEWESFGATMARQAVGGDAHDKRLAAIFHHPDLQQPARSRTRSAVSGPPVDELFARLIGAFNNPKRRAR